TITGNSAASGGGIYIAPNPTGTGSIFDTLVAVNTAGTSGPDVRGAVNTRGWNIIRDGADSTGWGQLDFVGTAENPFGAGLGAFGFHGGTTETFALLSNSPAIDAGGNTDAPSVDQRGYTRIVNGT